MPGQRDIEVRPAAAGELDSVAALWRESALAIDGPPQQVPPLEAMRRRIDAELQTGWALYVAMRGSQLVGMLAIKPAEAWLDQIFVGPGEQRQGVGKALLDVAKQAMPHGFELRMAATNERAGRFYEHEGLTRLREGVHPWTGGPVIFYGWVTR
jgi:putative acetyltransferase